MTRIAGSAAASAPDFDVSSFNNLLFRNFVGLIYFTKVGITAGLKMKGLIVAAATAIALPGPAPAANGVANRDWPDPGAALAARGPQALEPIFKIAADKMAMGPTSAPHLPGGTADGPRDTSSTCASPSASCPKFHRRTRHRRRSSAADYS